MKLLRGLHTAYGVIVFALLFIFFFFPLLIPIVFPSQYRLTGKLNRWWARALFTLAGLPYRVRYESDPDTNGQYIFCPNHFSYLDIPTLGLNRHDAIFVGKSDMEKIPLFGFMYRKLHITVDRARLKSRATTLVKSLEALDEGKSLIIFPEGGIVTEGDPVMGAFKDGAFRASIEKQIPIVPVTIPHNWIILPPHEFLLRWKTVRAVFHKPIDPSGYSMKDIEPYKQRVRDVIETELKKYLNNEN